MTGDHDLWFDADRIGVDLIVMCRISPGPRADDATFDPKPGDRVRLGDGHDDAAWLRARVVRRDGDRVTVRLKSACPLPVR